MLSHSYFLEMSNKRAFLPGDSEIDQLHKIFMVTVSKILYALLSLLLSLFFSLSVSHSLCLSLPLSLPLSLSLSLLLSLFLSLSLSLILHLPHFIFLGTWNPDTYNLAWTGESSSLEVKNILWQRLIDYSIENHPIFY